MHAGCGGEGGGVGIVCGEVGVGDADGEADGDMCWRTSSRELCSGGGGEGGAGPLQMARWLMMLPGQ